MTSRVDTTTFNCTDAYVLSTWWKPVLGYTDVPGDPIEPGDQECIIVDPVSGHRLLFCEVQELRDAEGRMHLDITPTDCRRDAEVKRVLALGATELADRRNIDGTGWVVLADPEGNRFCIVRSDEERAEHRTRAAASVGA